MKHGRAVWAASGVALAGILSASATAQTLFTTTDYRQDRELWTDPAYYRYNTARELTDMQVDDRYGEEGSRADDYTLASPYGYETSEEHYRAWLEEAGGPTEHTLETLPDWDGIWAARRSWLDSRNVQAATLAAALTPQYREYYVQQVKAESEGRHWWAAAFCLPDGFVRGLWRSPKQFVIRPSQVLIVSSMLAETQVRWIHTDGRSHPPEELHYPRWQGESIGFWDGDALVVHTNQIRQWNATHSMFEWSDRMTTVERYERVGDTIVGEVTFYDPVAFLEPLHAKLTFDLVTDPARARMSYDTCTDTNGPSSNVYVDENGVLNERTPGDPRYWDSTDPRPWAKHYRIGE